VGTAGSWNTRFPASCGRSGDQHDGAPGSADPEPPPGPVHAYAPHQSTCPEARILLTHFLRPCLSCRCHRGRRRFEAFLPREPGLLANSPDWNHEPESNKRLQAQAKAYLQSASPDRNADAVLSTRGERGCESGIPGATRHSLESRLSLPMWIVLTEIAWSISDGNHYGNLRSFCEWPVIRIGDADNGHAAVANFGEQIDNFHAATAREITIIAESGGIVAIAATLLRPAYRLGGAK